MSDIVTIESMSKAGQINGSKIYYTFHQQDDDIGSVVDNKVYSAIGQVEQDIEMLTEQIKTISEDIERSTAHRDGLVTNKDTLEQLLALNDFVAAKEKLGAAEGD